MKRTTILAVAVFVFTCGMLSAQGPGWRHSQRGGDGRERQSNLAEWAEAQAELKKKYPEKYKEIEKLQATNLFAALEKMRELASEASVTLPGSSRGNRGGRHGAMGPRGGMPGGGMGIPGGMRNPRASVEAELKAKYPAEYAEIEKQRMAVENKLEELAKKANVKLPATAESIRLKLEELKISGKFKAEFEEIEKLRASNPRAAFEKTRELMTKAGIEMPETGRGGRLGSIENGDAVPARSSRVNPMRRIMELRRKYPEEMKKLDALRREDPDGYRDGVMALLKKSEEEERKNTPGR